MVVELRGADPPRRKRKTRWAHHKADWVEFGKSCEAALSVPAPPQATVQLLATRFTAAVQDAAKEFIPRGARRDAKPWALHPDLQLAIQERRAARDNVKSGDPQSRTRWIEAKRRANQVEKRVTREQFRDFVTTELNRPTSVGRVSRLLKKWEGAVDDDHREGEAMRIGDRLLVTAEEKANAFAAQYAHVSRQVGFRAKRSAEDSIGRLVQNVQDGWQRPKYDRRAERPDGSTAQKYLLTAYDFSRAYDVVDHKLLKLRLLELGLPLCLVRWVWSWLRDRRVRVEVQGALSKERIFRAGLPQGSVLTAEASAPSRLSSVRGWRTLGRQMLAEVEVTAPIEPVLPPRIPPWERGGNVTFCLDVGPLRTGATEGEKIRAATRHLAALPQRATWLWTDGSVEGGVKDGGSGAVVIWSDGEEEDLKTPAGRHCSSYRAEMLALASGLEHLLDNPRDRDIPIVICTDSAAPSAEAELLWLQLYRDAALPPPAPLADAVASRAEPESVGHLVRCLCAAGRLADTAPLLERLRAAGHQPPLDALHAVIVAHAADGDLDTARDMAQALLPAASEDDSDHQLLLMRVYIAARRPGPLAALLSRWYQQRGQLTLGQGVSLLGQLLSSGQLEQLQQVVPLVPWPRWGHHWGGCVRLQRRLVRLGQHRPALLLLTTALSYGGSERELARLARALLTEMAVTDQPVSAIGEVCAALHDGPLLPTAWFTAAEVLYRVGRWKAALEVLLAARRAGLPLREHLFWPALLQQAREGSVEGVRDTLSEMVSAGAPPGLETLREYALPVYERDAWPPPERVVQHLKEAGLTAAAAADALVARLLASGHWHKAAAACERYASSVSVAVLIPAILYSSQQPAGPVVPADACARLLRCALDRRAAHEDPVGAVFVELSQTAARSPRQANLLRQLVQAAGPAGLRMSPAAAELACERLPSAELADLQSALQRLADAAVSSQPWENTDAGAGLPQDASVDDLEDHLVELTKKGGNTRGILRKLILMHCRKHNLERAVALEEELSRVSEPGADGEPLTPGVLSALLAVHVHHGRLEGALDYQRRLERSPGAGRFLDQFKRLDLAALLVRRGHSDDAVSLLERLEPEDDRSRLSMGCWRLLAAAADWGDPELTGQLLRLLETRGVVAPTAHHWGQMVRAHLVRASVDAAMEPYRAVLAVLAVLPAAAVDVTPECIGCICVATSGCNLSPGLNASGALGPFGITLPYFEDAGIGDEPDFSDETHESCAGDPFCAALTIRKYMERNARDCDGDDRLTCADFARIHRYGAPGCSLTVDTSGYWKRFQDCVHIYTTA
ncbi:Leucine-rich PPR motif-containing protein, mitochondrial [Amphibalanus amphitrite]|uniref:lysozyme n=1 Tax=Amphibalanus amphitrite TaxID=1232801 RepID=A0A6A4W0L7_AMPAM|nr:Leucine-rich PPR motif-containing protein, mitochondrial [Amphibalanus amphitrite]